MFKSEVFLDQATQKYVGILQGRTVARSTNLLYVQRKLDAAREDMHTVIESQSLSIKPVAQPSKLRLYLLRKVEWLHVMVLNLGIGAAIIFCIVTGSGVLT